MEAKKRTIIQAIVCVVLVCMIWGGYFLVKTYHTDRILDIKEDDFSWVYQVDSVEIDGKDFVLQGFAFELNKNAEEGSFEIVLEDIESGERYFPKMEYVDRKDVNEYFLCEYDYLQTGFEATIKEKKLSLEEKSYEVLLRVKGDRLAYQTGTYISNGKLVYVNPFEFEALDVAGTALEEVVENGLLRLYRPDYGVYVYQYGGELYWIAKEEYPFETDGNTVMEYQLETTQISRLPEVRLENKWYWDNQGFYFKEKEILEGNIEGCRVARSKIPDAYSITKIWTGLSKDVWIWRKDFRPYYFFEGK